MSHIQLHLQATHINDDDDVGMLPLKSPQTSIAKGHCGAG